MYAIRSYYDALGAEAAGALGVARVVGVGPDAEVALRVGPLEQLLQVVVGDVRDDRRQLAGEDLHRRLISNGAGETDGWQQA